MNSSSNAPVTESDFQGQTLLIIDDNPNNLGVLADYLEDIGFTVLVAQDGESGLDRVRYGQPDLILLDVMMPGIDGFETCRRLKGDQKTKDIPVIFMTALMGPEDKVKGFEVGAVDYITKPFQQEEVLARITTHLRLRNLTLKLQQELIERRRIEETLAKRAIELEIVARVSMAASRNLDPNELLQTVVDLTKTDFDLYHAHIYLLNENDDMLELIAGAGKIGRQMVAQGLQIPLDQEPSLVARAARIRAGVIINDVREEPGWLPNPLLPNTRSELVVPLIVGERMLGVLDVQADEVGHFTEEDVRTQTTLAAQVAVALENIRLFREERKSGERFQHIIASSIIDHVYVTEITMDGAMLNSYIAPNVEELTGYPLENFLTDWSFWPSTVIHPDDRARAAAQVKQFAKSQNNEVEYRLVRANGEIIWVRDSVRVEKDETRQSLIVYGVVSDITEKKQTEQSLAKRAAELETVAEVSVAVSTVLETETLIQKVADLTQQQFDLYHVHIYLLDESGEALSLLAGAGQAGRQMIAGQERIPLTQEQSLVARAARTGQGVIVNNLRETPNWLPNPLLPEARSEMAIPMSVGNDLLGVLDVQSDEVGRFIEEDVRIQTILAAQVAVALQNARSLERAEQTLKDLNALTRRLTRTGWEEYLAETTSETGYAYDLQRLSPIDLADANIDQSAVEVEGAKIQVLESKIETSLLIQGEAVGQLTISEPQTLTDEAPEIIEAVAERLSTHLENLRLTEQTERALAEQQQARTLLDKRVKELNSLNEIGREIAEAPVVSQLLEWVAQRIPPAMGYPELCQVAIEYNNQVYGVAEAKTLPDQIVNALRIGDEIIGRIYIAYTEKRDFLDEESALLGGIAARVSGYIESRYLFEQTQDALAEVRRLASIVENHPDFIGSGTMDGKAIYVNPTGLKMMGLPSDYDVAQMKATEFYLPKDAEKLINDGIPAALKEGFWSAEASLLRTDGSAVPVEETIGINYDTDGSPIGFSITMRDITERKQAEAERERLLAEVQDAYHQFVEREWSQFLNQQPDGSWHVEHQSTHVQDDHSNGKSGHQGSQGTTLDMPIALRGQAIGTVVLEDIDPHRKWTPEEKVLVEAVSEQLAQTIENLRLFGDTQQQAAREQLTRKITDQMRASPDIDSIIETGLTELAKALGVSRTYVKLTPKPDQFEAAEAGIEQARSQLKRYGHKEN